MSENEKAELRTLFDRLASADVLEQPEIARELELRVRAFKAHKAATRRELLSQAYQYNVSPILQKLTELVTQSFMTSVLVRSGMYDPEFQDPYTQKWMLDTGFEVGLTSGVSGISPYVFTKKPRPQKRDEIAIVKLPQPLT